jgi:hypothetical protein
MAPGQSRRSNGESLCSIGLSSCRPRPETDSDLYSVGDIRNLFRRRPSLRESRIGVGGEWVDLTGIRVLKPADLRRTVSRLGWTNGI